MEICHIMKNPINSLNPSTHHALSCVWLFATSWTVALQALLFMGFSRQEYLSGLPFPPPGVLTYPEIKSMSSLSPALQGDSFLLEPSEKPNSLKRQQHFEEYVSEKGKFWKSSTVRTQLIRTLFSIKVKAKKECWRNSDAAIRPPRANHLPFCTLCSWPCLFLWENGSIRRVLAHIESCSPHFACFPILCMLGVIPEPSNSISLLFISPSVE